MNKNKEYTRRAREKWGKTDVWRECEEKNAGRSEDSFASINDGLMVIFTEFGAMMEKSPDDAQVQAQAAKLQAYITEHYYTCTRQILAGLAQMYRTEEFTENIDRAGGEGCAAFAADAIEIYCK